MTEMVNFGCISYLPYAVGGLLALFVIDALANYKPRRLFVGWAILCLAGLVLTLFLAAFGFIPFIVRVLDLFAKAIVYIIVFFVLNIGLRIAVNVRFFSFFFV